jgi:peptide/nickel transport system substrate-binding protein
VDRVVQTPAPNRVRFVLGEPWPDFIAFYGTSATGAGWIVPRRYTEKVGEEGFKKAPVGAGPYKFASFNPGVELVLDAFPEYWRKPPQIKRLVMRSITDETTRAAAVKTGEVAAPIFQQGFIWGVGPGVAEPAAGAIQGYPYVGPAEDLKLK